MASGGASSGGQGALVFSNTDMNLEQAQVLWASLRKGITEIQNGNASTLRYEELYRNAYTLVLHKHGELLYNGVLQTIQEKLEEIAAHRVLIASDDQLIRVLVAEWNRHKLIMTMIRDVLMYMDKTFCERDNRPLIYVAGIELFRRYIVHSGSSKTKLQLVLLRNIHRERNSELIERVLMKHCLAMLIEISDKNDAYENGFEHAFLEETRQFYRRESQQFIAQNTVWDYMKKVDMWLNDEEGRADGYLYEGTGPKLKSVVQEELIAQYAQTLVENPNTGCRIMFERNMIEDLARMYSLFKRVDPPILPYISDCMKVLIRETGEAFVTDPESKKNPCKFVQSVLDLRRKFSTILTDAFAEDRTFARCMKESFEYFVNLDSRAAQYLSLYMDGLLRKGLRGVAEDEVEANLENVVTVFRYILDKDVFEDFYKQHLASRLLLGAHISDDIEKSMISKLKAECGHQFTSKMEGMFKNMDLSRELNLGFHNAHLLPPGSCNLYVNVLTSGFWPWPEMPPCVLPRCVASAADYFGSFYMSKHAGHKLTWQTSLGSAELLVQFRKGRKELIMHTYQMCVMMLFNNADRLTYAEIQSLTGIQDNELQRQLLSLAHPKIKILLKQPNTKKIEPDHVFIYNYEYSSQLYRVKVPLLALTDSLSRIEADVPASVHEARKNRIEAAIVRIMKARRKLDHNNLVAEVSKQLLSRFAAEPSLIKRRIEDLIEREYLERDKEDRRIYHYLA